MKISEYPAVSIADHRSLHIVDTPSGTRKITHDDLLISLVENIPAMHRVLIRGKNLGASMTSAQKEAIKSGKFTGLFLGDYWTAVNNKWRIVDFDYFPDVRKHHIVVMPDDPLVNVQMHRVGGNVRGFGGSTLWSEMHTTETYRSGIKTVFGAPNVFSHSIKATTSFDKDSSGQRVTATTYVTQNWTEDIPNEISIYGSRIRSGVGVPGNGGANEILNRQFALFAAGWTKGTREFWLSDQTWDNYFAAWRPPLAWDRPATDTCGVRPYYVVGDASSGNVTLM